MNPAIKRRRELTHAGHDDSVSGQKLYWYRFMPRPHVSTFYISDVIEPFSELGNEPCFVVNDLAKPAASGPPLFWKPPYKTLFSELSYDCAPFGHVLAEIAFGTFLNGLDVTSTAKLRDVFTEDYLKGLLPNLVMVFGTNSPLFSGDASYEKGMEMKHWDSGALITLTLNLGNGDTITTQAIVPQLAAHFPSIRIHDFMPALMKAAHHLKWHRRDRNSCEGNALFWRSALEFISAIPDSSCAITRNPISAIARDDMGLSLMPKGDVLL